VDGVLLVYRIGTVPKGLLKRAINQLLQVKSNVIGVILNGMRPEVSPDFEDYKHYKYYYSYGEDGTKHRKKKAHSMFDTRDVNLRNLEGTDSAKAAGWIRKGWRSWKKTLGFSLLVLAVGLSAGGLLWQNNMLGNFKSNLSESSGGKQELKIPIREQPAPPAPPVADAGEKKPAAREEPKELPIKPEPNPQTAAENNSIAAVPPPKEEAGRVEKPEQEPPAEELKAEARAPVAVALPKKREEKKSPQPPSGATYPFSLFLGSVPHLDQAEQGVSKYMKNGLPVYYTEVALSKGIWYRLYAGTFESAEQAERFKKEKGLDGAEVKETPFANLIGTFTSQDKLEGKMQSLKSLGFSPYVIREPDGKGRLLVGAFQNEERAKRQHEELQSKGIENQIVQR
jgi:cell division septation protein DedD